MPYKASRKFKQELRLSSTYLFHVANTLQWRNINSNNKFIFNLYIFKAFIRYLTISTFVRIFKRRQIQLQTTSNSYLVQQVAIYSQQCFRATAWIQLDHSRNLSLSVVPSFK